MGGQLPSGGTVSLSSLTQLPGVEALVRELVKLAPVYFVSGNHDWASGAEQELFEDVYKRQAPGGPGPRPPPARRKSSAGASRSPRRC